MPRPLTVRGVHAARSSPLDPAKLPDSTVPVRSNRAQSDSTGRGSNRWTTTTVDRAYPRRKRRVAALSYPARITLIWRLALLSGRIRLTPAEAANFAGAFLVIPITSPDEVALMDRVSCVSTCAGPWPPCTPRPASWCGARSQPSRSGLRRCRPWAPTSKWLGSRCPDPCPTRQSPIARSLMPRAVALSDLTLSARWPSAEAPL